MISNEEIHVPVETLPKERITGEIKADHVALPRCTIRYGAIVHKGRYGKIQMITRGPAASSSGSAASPLCIKKPNKPEYKLAAEAIIQWIVHTALISARIFGAVPQVYDIYQFAGESRFSMDYVKGGSSFDAIRLSPNPEHTWTHILAQTALLLGYLQETINLDHQDLKADNLWIRPTPIHYILSVGGQKWSITSPFQVVLLDFGYACLGGQDGNAVVNLSEETLPFIDACPKEGRDLFQLLVSLWSIPELRSIMSPAFQKQISDLLSYNNSPFTSLIHMTDRSQWSYLVVKDRDFKHPLLNPYTILEKLSTTWLPNILIQKVE